MNKNKRIKELEERVAQLEQRTEILEHRFGSWYWYRPQPDYPLQPNEPYSPWILCSPGYTTESSDANELNR